MVSKFEAMAKELFCEIQNMQKCKRENHLRDDGIHGEQFVLYFLHQKSKPVLPNEISKEMHVSTARIATALNGLQDKGFITREIDARDRRRILVELTYAGMTMAEDLAKKHLQYFTDILESLGEVDATEYVRITRRISDSISKVKPC